MRSTMKRAVLRPAFAAARSILDFSSSLKKMGMRLFLPVRGLRARFRPRDGFCETRLRGDITLSCKMREPVILCQPQSTGIYKCFFCQVRDVRTERLHDYYDPVRFGRKFLPSHFSDDIGFLGGAVPDRPRMRRSAK